MKSRSQLIAALVRIATDRHRRRDGALSHVGDRLRHAGGDPLPRHASAVRAGADVPAASPHGSRRRRRQLPPTLLDYRCWCWRRAPILYLFVNYDYVVNRIYYIDDLTPTDMVDGRGPDVIVLEATRRVIGWALPITAIVFLVYGLFIARLEPMRLLDQLYMTTEGIFGIPLSVSAAYVLIFVLFGSLHGAHRHRPAVHGFRHGADRPHRRRSRQGLGGESRACSARSPAAPSPTSWSTGRSRIPLMKRTGFPPHFAAGVEAAASTGGQIMPPIMGAAAFVMAEFLARVLRRRS